MRTATLFAAAVALCHAQPLSACVDYWTPPAITVTVEYDATYSEVLITVSNLHLFGGPNGAFCTCGITTYTDMFSDLQYIAFVDSGTYAPVPGFAVWEASTAAGTAWSAASIGDWDAFIAEVVAPGITTGTPVQLLIRSSLPPGFTFNLLDSSVTYTAMGTDEWSPALQDLAYSHNSLGQLGEAPREYIVQPLSFFEAVDGLVTAVAEPQLGELPLLVQAPAPGMVQLAMPGLRTPVQLDVYDLMGRTLMARRWDGAALTIGTLPAGAYVARAWVGGQAMARTFVVP